MRLRRDSFVRWLAVATACAASIGCDQNPSGNAPPDSVTTAPPDAPSAACLPHAIAEWSYVANADPALRQPIDAAITSDGVLHALWESSDPDRIHYVTSNDGDAWTTAAPAREGDSVYDRWSQFAKRGLGFDASGNVYVGAKNADYLFEVSSRPRDDAEAAWSVEVAQRFGDDIDMVVDASGVVHLAFAGLPDGSRFTAHYARRDGSNWTVEPIPFDAAVAREDDFHPQVIVGDDGRVHLVYLTYDPDGTGIIVGGHFVMHAVRVAPGQWRTEVIGENSEKDVYARLAPDGSLVVAFTEFYWGNLRVLRVAADDSVHELATLETWPAQDRDPYGVPRIAFDECGRLHVLHEHLVDLHIPNQGKLRLEHEMWTGSEWLVSDPLDTDLLPVPMNSPRLLIGRGKIMVLSEGYDDNPPGMFVAPLP